MRLNMEEPGTHRVNSPTKLTVEVAILGEGAGMKLSHGKANRRVFSNQPPMRLLELSDRWFLPTWRRGNSEALV